MPRIVQIKNVNQPGKLYPRDADKMEKISAAYSRSCRPKNPA